MPKLKLNSPAPRPQTIKFPEKPLCPIFGQCGGCQYQDISYPEELEIKEKYLAQILATKIFNVPDVLETIVPSPRPDHYRCVLDMKLLKMHNGEVLIGFSPHGQNRVIAAETCPIALASINDFLPELKRQAILKLTPRYRNANLVVKAGDGARVCWGGIGRRSLVQEQDEYLWTEIDGRRIYYSLATFFQANLLILPELMKKIRALGVMNAETVFYDLYGGVGLFGFYFAREVKQVFLIEENSYALTVAQFTRRYHQTDHFEILGGRVEDRLTAFSDSGQVVAMIDPPRCGMSPVVIAKLTEKNRPQTLLYLSCNPETLARDLADLSAKAWQIQKIIPFDFFPRTRHVETLAVLTS